jgi:uncharacterized phage-associated protein
MPSSTKKVLLYLISKLGICEGRKKLMKLMFLIEHYDLKNKILLSKPRLGDTFLIYQYGVFSFDVMRAYEELLKEGKISEDFSGTTVRPGVQIDLEEGIKEVVDGVVQSFGRYSGYELETLTLRMLKIRPFEKDRYFGRKVREILAGR